MNKVLIEMLLLQRIGNMKKQLVKIACNEGINSKETLKCSQELDNLLNLHMKHFARKNNY
jgi:hypothetical protein